MMIPPFVVAYYTDSDYEKESVKLRLDRKSVV